MQAKQHRLSLIIGSEFRLEDELRFVLLATDRASYGRLAALITLARRNASKGDYRLDRIERRYGGESYRASMEGLKALVTSDPEAPPEKRPLQIAIPRSHENRPIER